MQDDSDAGSPAIPSSSANFRCGRLVRLQYVVVLGESEAFAVRVYCTCTCMNLYHTGEVLSISIHPMSRYLGSWYRYLYGYNAILEPTVSELLLPCAANMDPVGVLADRVVGAWNARCPASGAETLEDVVAGLRQNVIAIQSAIESVHANALAARADFSGRLALIEETRLMEDISVAVASKVAALQAEGVAVDSALENVMALLADPASTDYGSMLTLAAAISAIPTGPVEPVTIAFIYREASAVPGRISAPRGIRAGDVTLQPCSSVKLGRTAVYDLVLCAEHPSHDLIDVAASLRSLVPHVVVCAELETPVLPGAQYSAAHPAHPLPVSLSIEAGERCVRMYITVPARLVASLSAREVASRSIILRSISIAGTAVRSHALPATTRVSAVPLSMTHLEDHNVCPGALTPAVDAHGIVYVPDASLSLVQRFSPDGSLLKPFSVPELLTKDAAGDQSATLFEEETVNFHHLAFDEASDTLLLAADNLETYLLAISRTNGTKRWAVPRCTGQESALCRGVGVLSLHRLAVTCTARGFIVIDISTGTVTHELAADDPLSLTTDPDTGLVFVCFPDDGLVVYAWDTTSRSLVICGPVHPPTGSYALDYFNPHFRPTDFACTVTPWVSDDLPACLVLAAKNCGEIAVLSLPDLRWIYTHDFGLVAPRMTTGLSVDPAGSGVYVALHSLIHLAAYCVTRHCSPPHTRSGSRQGCCVAVAAA